MLLRAGCGLILPAEKHLTNGSYKTKICGNLEGAVE